MTVLKTENLTHYYSNGMSGEVAAIKNINIEIEKGELVGIIGHTGSGKSTLLQHFNGLLKPDAGRVLLEGRDIWESKESIRSARFKVGLCFQYPEYQLFEETVYKDIAFGPKNMGLDNAETDRRVRRAAQFVGLRDEYLEKSPFDLSGGEKRRAAIAGVMAMEPEVLILDEPTAGLDPKGRDEILGLISGLHRDSNMTVILVSHSMEDVARYVDRLIVLNDGRVFADGKPRDIYNRYSELEKIGLAAPQTLYLIKKLRENGINIPDNIIDPDEAIEAISKAL